MAQGIIRSYTRPSGSYGAGAHWSFEWTSAKKSPGISTVTWKLYTRGRYESPKWLVTGCWMSVTKNGATTQLYANDGESWSGEDYSFKDILRASGSFDVKHDTDGSASFNINFEVYIYEYAHKTNSGTGVLDNNPAQSLPSVSASSVEMGSPITIYTNRSSTDFTHNLSYSIADGNYVSLANGIGDSYTWPSVPLSLASSIPADPSGVVTIKCDTYAGNTLLGTAYTSFTAVVPNIAATQPQVSMETTLVSNLPAAFNGLYIQGKTSVRATYEAKSDYSTINSYLTSVPGASATGNPATVSLPNAGSIAVTGRVTDARGYYTERTTQIDVIPYSKPILKPYSGYSSIDCKRWADGAESPSGTSLIIRAKRSYHKVESDGVQNNFCAIQFCYMPNGGAWSGWHDILPGKSVDADEVAYVVNDISFSPALAYFIKVRVIDDIGESDTSGIIEIPTEDVCLHLKPGGKGAAFFKYAEHDGVLEVDGDLEVSGRVKSVEKTVAVCESGEWTPTLVSGANSLTGFSQCTYHKTGNIVTVSILCWGTFANRNSDTITFSLPFNVASKRIYGLFGYTNAGLTDLYLAGNCGTATCSVMQHNAAGSEVAVTGTGLGRDNWTFQCCLTYGTDE